MHTDYILAFLTFAVFGGTESARLFWFEPLPLPSIQDKFDTINKNTYPTLEALDAYVKNTESFQRNQQGTIINNAIYNLTQTTKAAVDKAKKEGKNVDKECVNKEKAQYIKELELLKKTVKKCIDNAMNTAKNSIQEARLFYLNISSTGYAATQNYERQWAKECLTVGGDQCMVYMAFSILYTLANTEAESKNAIENSKKAYSNQKCTWIKCRKTLQEKIKEMDEKHTEKMAKVCIERDWHLNWVL